MNVRKVYQKRLLKYCKKIIPYVKLNNKQIEYYNHTAYEILQDKIGLILPTFLVDDRPKRGAILASVLGGVASCIIGLAYEGISSFLHHKRHHSLCKTVHVIEKKTDIQWNKIHHTMIMYGTYNSDTLTDLIDTVHRMHNKSIWQEKMFIGKVHE